MASSLREFMLNVQNSSFGQTIKSAFTLPTIGLPSSLSLADPDAMTKFKSIENVLASLGLARGIPIYASSQKELGENNIGRQVLIRANSVGTEVVTDNIAPLPRTWQITGYIGLMKQGTMDLSHPYTQGVEPNPSISNFNVLVFLQAIKDYFRYLRVLRAPFKFISKEGSTIDVLMQNYTFEDEPISEYATKVTMTLMEYVALTLDGNTYDIRNSPGIGSAYGVAAKYSTSVGQSIGSSLKLLVGGQ